MTEYMYAFTTNDPKIVPQSRSPRIQRSSNIPKSITKFFTATITYHIYFCFRRCYFLLIRFPYLLFSPIIFISTTGYSPLYKQITQVHLVQEITTNMKLLVTLPVRHKILIFFFSIFLFFIFF